MNSSKNNQQESETIKLPYKLIDWIYAPNSDVQNRTLYLDRLSKEPFTMEHELTEFKDLNHQDEKELRSYINQSEEFIAIEPLSPDFELLLFDEFIESNWRNYFSSDYSDQMDRIKEQFRQGEEIDQIISNVEEPIQVLWKTYCYNRSKEMFERELHEQGLIVDWINEPVAA